MADIILTTPPARAAVPLRAWYLVAAAAAFAVMMAAILSPSLWFLNFVHVMTGALWTGIDLFMGFIIGPVMRHVSFDTRRAMIGGLIPRTDLAYPEFWWVIAALAIVTVLTVQGLGYLLPTNARLYFEVQKPRPDTQKIARWMRTYLRPLPITHSLDNRRSYQPPLHKLLLVPKILAWRIGSGSKKPKGQQPECSKGVRC